MGNDVAITAGSGTTVHTSEVTIGGVLGHVQLVQPYTPHQQVQVTPVIDTNIHISGDCLGPLTTVAGMARVSGVGGIIKSIQILDKTQAQRSPMTILLFKQTVTTAATNAPFACSDADMALLACPQIEILATHYNTAWPGTPLNSVATLPHNDVASTPITMNIPYVCAATSLFMQLVVRGTPTYTSASDIVVTFNILQD